MADKEKPVHEYDEDGVCVFCGFDGAEHAWRRMRMPPELRKPLQPQAIYCEPKRPQ